MRGLRAPHRFLRGTERRGRTQTKKRQSRRRRGCRSCLDGARGSVSRIRSAHGRSVPGSWGGHHLSGTAVADRLKRPTCTAFSAGSLNSSEDRRAVRLGLTPRGVCLAVPVARNAGALLPHPCTPCPDVCRGGTALCCTCRRPDCCRGAFPLGSTGPCGVRTFLTAAPAAAEIGSRQVSARRSDGPIRTHLL